MSSGKPHQPHDLQTWSCGLVTRPPTLCIVLHRVLHCAPLEEEVVSGGEVVNDGVREGCVFIEVKGHGREGDEFV